MSRPPRSDLGPEPLSDLSSPSRLTPTQPRTPGLGPRGDSESGPDTSRARSLGVLRVWGGVGVTEVPVSPRTLRPGNHLLSGPHGTPTLTCPPEGTWDFGGGPPKSDTLFSGVDGTGSHPVSPLFRCLSPEPHPCPWEWVCDDP